MNPRKPQGRRRQPLQKGRASRFLGVRRSQAELDFVDVDIYGDVPLFINPGALRRSKSQWAQQCVYLMQDFMAHVVGRVSAGDLDGAHRLVADLREPNETHLGYTTPGKKSQGHAVGEEFSDRVIDALTKSKAGQTGKIIDLEDTVLLVPGISSDLISDMTTNIIRGPLIDYTNEITRSYGVDQTDFSKREDQAVWDPDTHSWEFPEVTLPIANGLPLILVPKFAVRSRVDANSYFRDYLMEFIAKRETDAQDPNLEFVRVLKDGFKKPRLVNIQERYREKSEIADIITSDDEVYAKYVAAKLRGEPLPFEQTRLLATLGEKEPNLDNLLAEMRAIPTGNDSFHEYELACERLWSAMFSRVLRFPQPQQPQNEGRKIVDVVWVNDASDGFFNWIKEICPAHFVITEFKNWGREIGNPEFDQLANRMGPSKGMFGFLICRSMTDKDTAFARARDYRTDHPPKYLIPLDDDDMAELVAAVKEGPVATFAFLQAKFRRIAM